jgi:arylsulfatase A-like enzyme
MSRHEMNNTLLCRGPSFRKGERILSPSGNIDVMPTVLDLLGVAVPESVHGRVLAEAFSDFEDEIVSETKEYIATRVAERHTYEQRIVVSRVGNSIYLDEGNSSVQIV